MEIGIERDGILVYSISDSKFCLLHTYPGGFSLQFLSEPEEETFRKQYKEKIAGHIPTLREYVHGV